MAGRRRTGACGAGVLGLVLTCLARAAPAATAPPLVLPSDAVIAGEVQGIPVRLRVSPVGFAYPVLDPGLVARLGLRAEGSGAARIGVVRLPGHVGRIAWKVDGVGSRTPALWFSTALAVGVDAVIGPEALPAGRVVFPLSTPKPGETAVALPMAESADHALGVALSLGGRTVFAQWDLDRPDNLASAAAAAQIASAYGGKLADQVSETPVTFGVLRPTRRMDLAKALPIGPLRVSQMQVRVADLGDAEAIADRGVDAADIVVHPRRREGPPGYSLVIGRAALAGCSALIFDRAAREVILVCMPVPASSGP